MLATRATSLVVGVGILIKAGASLGLVCRRNNSAGAEHWAG
jgi:hypothetical protein